MDNPFSNRCRACAVLQISSGKMISLFDNNLFAMFTHCTSLEISSNDSLPNCICSKCFRQLSAFNEFRRNCAESDAYFREQILAESIKLEQVDETVVKNEENEQSSEIKSEFYEMDSIGGNIDEFDCSGESIVQYDTELIVCSPEVIPDTADPILAKPTTSKNKTTSKSRTESKSKTKSKNKTTNDHTTTSEGAKYFCDYCGKGFREKSYLGSHMTAHSRTTERKPKNYPCTVDGCSEVFKTKKPFNVHRLNVHNIEPKSEAATEKRVKFSCTKCPQWFTEQYKLDGHIRSKHEGLKPYKCPQCEKAFCRYGAYEHHLRTAHNTVLSSTKSLYRCSYDGCDREYGLMDSLKAHINRHHLGIIPVKRDQKLICEQCGKSFVNGYKLKKHIYTHTGKLPHACKMCPKTFGTPIELKIHTMRHLKVKPFECPTCGARKTTNKELHSHLNYHSKEITYPCKECPRIFGSYGAVNRHVRIHHRNHKPYICPHCRRAFSKAETMRNHVMTHTGEKPFACPICDHRFIQGVALKTHMKVHAKKWCFICCTPGK